MDKAKSLFDKMNDYKRFGLSLIALSAFLYLGVVMPIDGKTVLKTYILMGGTISLLL
ncbi:YrhC family protein, partial [Heyndrickxia sporothermodurans]